MAGTVTDESGLPLPGATILVENTNRGVTSDFDGNFSISASNGEVLIVSYVGYQSSQITVEPNANYSISLAPQGQLEEVVVTSLGIKREKQALGYAVSEVQNESLEQRAEGDIGRVLTGKASGVQITSQSGLSGSGTSIIIRGFNSFSQDNQPLFIVDGVPFSSETNASGRQGERNDFVNGNNGSSRFLDIDPNNIESVNILKGLAAATLYGTQGRNGVILITTKSGSNRSAGAGKNEITINSSYFSVALASKPDYQNEYGNGFDQSFGWFFSNWGPSFKEDGPAGWSGQNTINGTTSGTPGFLKHPFTTASAATGIPAVLENLGIAPDALYEWKPYDSVGDFFKTGTALNTNINIRGASDDGRVSYNINYGNLDDKGFTRANTLKRNTLSIGGQASLKNGLLINSTLNFSKTDFKSPPIAAGLGSNVDGESASVFANVFYTPRSVDLMGLPYQNPVTGESIYYRQNNSIQHPLWMVHNAGTSQLTNRVFGGASISYALNDNLNLSYRYGIDIYSENNANFANKGGKTGSQVNRNEDLLQDVQVFTKHQNGNEALMRTIQASDFTTGPKGLPRVDLKLSLKDALTTLGIGSSSVAGGDKITFRFQLNLTDGRSFTDIDSSSSLTGSYFAAPFSYSKIIKCIPIGAIDGLYTLNLVDSCGDGWNGAALVITVDGEKESFTLGSNLSSGKFTKKIEGATTMSFVFESGEFDSEVSYTIVYQSLAGNNEQTAISDGPSPTPGEKILSICQ